MDFILIYLIAYVEKISAHAFLSFFFQGLSKPANIKDAQDDYDYENMQKDDGDDYNYDDDENLSVDKSYNTEYNRVPQGPPPVLEVLETEVSAKPGETARLVCRAKNLSSKSIGEKDFIFRKFKC